MRTCKRIISLFGIFAIVCSFLPFYAYAEDYVAPTGFGTWLMSQSDNSLYRTLMKYVTLGTGCDQNADGRHRANMTADGFVGTLVNDASSEYMGYYYCCCKDCGQYFLAAPSEVNSAINNAYNNMVSEMPFTGLDSNGGFIWWPDWNDGLEYNGSGFSDSKYKGSHSFVFSNSGDIGNRAWFDIRPTFDGLYRRIESLKQKGTFFLILLKRRIVLIMILLVF